MITINRKINFSHFMESAHVKKYFGLERHKNITS